MFLDSLSSKTVKSFSPLLWIVLPAWLLLWLVVNPPHDADLDIARLIDAAGVGGAIDAAFGSGMRPLMHVASKWVTIAAGSAAFIALIALYVSQRKNACPLQKEQAQALTRRLIYFLAAVLTCVLVVAWLKATTGVACPRNTIPFGGTSPIVSPDFGFSFKPGRCWPGGAAGSGFCLFALFFALRDIAPRLARAALIAALALGSISGFERMSSGLHFLSHNLVSLLLDWLICAGLYIAFFARKSFVSKLRGELTGGISFASGLAFCALWWALVFNGPTLWHAASISGEPFMKTGSGALFFACAALFIAAAAALLCIFSLLPKYAFKGLVVVLHIAGAVSFAAAVLYGAVMTADMVRNALATDTREVAGYMGARTIFVFVWAALPPIAATVLLNMPSRAAAAVREGASSLSRLAAGFKAGLKNRMRPAAAALGCLVLTGAVLLVNYQNFAGAIRTDRTLRYQLVPVSLVNSLVKTVLVDSSPDKARVRIVTDPAPVMQAHYDKPALFIVLVGETTRSASWGLAGYNRNTTPEVEDHHVISFPVVTACGTSTDVSLPCMMSRIGRSDYDRKRILSEEALPDVLQRAGYDVQWIDNQSGCKGTCSGVPSRRADAALDPALCPQGHCYDGILVKEVERKANEIAASGAKRPTVLFLHMMGQHGPAYTQRSPEKMKVYGPECTDADLSSCTKDEIVNAYDNGVHYTDEVIDSIIDMLGKRTDIASGLVFVSDHGESLGEKGLYLHGAPYFLGISEQIDVPMLMWFSKDFENTAASKIAALKARAEKSERPTHENLYHTVLGLLGVTSTTYRESYDLTRTGPQA